MTRSLRSSKVVLVADRRADGSRPAAAHVKRYRLARLPFDSRPAAPDSRYEQLKRAYE